MIELRVYAFATFHNFFAYQQQHRGKLNQKRLQAVNNGSKELDWCSTIGQLPAQPLSSAAPGGMSFIAKSNHIVPFLHSTREHDKMKEGAHGGTIRTVEDLRAKVQLRNAQSSATTERMKIQREEDEKLKLTLLLPRVCDEIRFMSRRDCRSAMILAECVEGVMDKLNDSTITAKHVEQMIHRITETIPEYITMTERGVINGLELPATIRVNNSIAYNPVKLKLQQASTQTRTEQQAPTISKAYCSIMI